MATTCLSLIFFLSGYFCILHAFDNYAEENILTKIPYKGISVSVWQRNATFYLLPLGFLEKDTIGYSDEAKSELKFDIILTNKELKLTAVNFLRTFTGECIQIENIQMIPTKKIFVNLKSKPGDFIRLNQSWNKTMVSNPENLKMKIPCQANPQACSLFKVMLEGDPLLKLSFNVTGNQFQLPVTKVQSLSGNNSTGDVTAPKMVKCKSEEQVFRESLVAAMQEIKKSVQGISKAVRNISNTNTLTYKAIKEKFECGFRNSIVLQGKLAYKARLMEMLSSSGKNGKCWKKCFTASEYDYSAQAFHFMCDDKGPTVTLLIVGDKISGGYTDLNWEVNGAYARSSNSFLFSLNNNLKMMSTKEPQYAIYNGLTSGPTFGAGHDLHISDKCNMNTVSYSNPGNYYQPPSGYTYGSSRIKSLLTGSYNFKCDEYEVYYLA